VLLYRPLERDENEGTFQDHGSRKVVARAFRVFNAEQVDDFAPTPAHLLPESERLAAAEAFFHGQGASVWFGSDSAFYDPASDVISMPAFSRFKSASAYYSAFAHELAHWSGAKCRLNRDLSGRFGSEAYAMEELIAELAAAFIAAHLGLGCEPRRDHAPYIASWLRVLRGDNRAIMAAAIRAQSATDYLIKLSTAAESSSPPIATANAELSVGEPTA
jgi:antirestriction protein ArdC